MPTTILLVAGFVIGLQAAGNPTGTLAVVTSFVPGLSPMVMPVRQAAGGAAWWEVLVSALIMLVAIAVVVRTFVTIRALWGHELPHDGDLTRRHRIMAVAIGVVFGFIFGLTSVGAGAFFGMALILLFPLSTRRVVGTDLFHGAIVTIPAAIASWFLLPDLHFGNVALLMAGSVPGILIGSQITVAVPEKALRGSLAGVLALSSLKMFGAF
jgi:uncharacterized membrane protein YfcA